MPPVRKIFISVYLAFLFSLGVGSFAGFHVHHGPFRNVDFSPDQARRCIKILDNLSVRCPKESVVDHVLENGVIFFDATGSRLGPSKASGCGFKCFIRESEDPLLSFSVLDTRNLRLSFPIRFVFPLSPRSPPFNS